MMWLYYLFCLCLVTPICTNESEMKYVLELTDDSFPTTVEASKQPFFMMFYAPWCGHCKRLKPIWANISDSEVVSLGGGMKLGMLDCTTWPKTCNKYNVDGYPGLRYFVDGKGFEYRGIRAADALEDFIKRILQPNIPQLSTVEEINELVSKAAVVTVLFIQPNKPTGEFDAILSDVQLECAGYSALQLVTVHSTKLLKDYTKQGDLAVVIINDVTTLVYEGELEGKPIMSFIEKNRFLEVEELDQTKFYSLGHQGKLMAILLYDKPKEVENKGEAVGVKALREIAKDQKYRDVFVFGRLDGVYWYPWIKQFGIQTADYPYLFAYDAVNELHFKNSEIAIPLSKALIADDTKTAHSLIAKFLDRVASGDEPSRVSGFSGYLGVAKKEIENAIKMLLAASMPVQFVAIFFPLALLGFLIKWCCCGSQREKQE